MFDSSVISVFRSSYLQSSIKGRQIFFLDVLQLSLLIAFWIHGQSSIPLTGMKLFHYRVVTKSKSHCEINRSVLLRFFVPKRQMFFCFFSLPNLFYLFLFTNFSTEVYGLGIIIVNAFVSAHDVVIRTESYYSRCCSRHATFLINRTKFDLLGSSVKLKGR